MQFLNDKTNINFLKFGRIAVVFSAILVLISIVELGFFGLNFGLDFTGGTRVEVHYPQTADLKEVRTRLKEAGLDGAIVQYFGTSNDVAIRIPPVEGKKGQEVGEIVLKALREGGQKVEMRQIEFVGPSVGEELTQQGILAMVLALICIMIYVAARFEWKFSVGAVAALAHDVLITIGIFSLRGLEFDLTVLAAILAVIGYSLNDTIVVYDRIRENFLKLRKATPEEVVNKSINQTLSRTLITSGTTIMVLVALFVWGGALIHGFATALLIGILIGTYSSIYVASTLALTLGVSKEDLMPPQVEKEGADQPPLL
ncbi:MAG: protein translocase subunit SecF [Gammaproteobacteria bacterium]|nr:MAG: protein translocase subunit SecF [Gammaproteobacteria bacterium]